MRLFLFQAANQHSVQHEGRATRIASMTIDFIGVFCNTLLIIVILVDPLNLLRRGAWFTILNLSIADLLAAASNFIEVSLPSEFHTQSITTLRTARFFWMFGAGGSFMLLTFLTIQIYLIAKYPIRSKLMISSKKIGLSCTLIWILAILLGLSNIAYIRHDLSLDQLMKIYIAQISVLELSVLVQVILKVLIIREIMKSRRETEVLASAEQSNTKHKEIAKTIVILNVILIVTAFPYFVAKQIEYLYKLEVIQGDVLVRLFSNYYEPIAVLNFALNPILYSLRLSDYRRSLIVLFCTCPPKRGFCKRLSKDRAGTSVTSFRATIQETTTL